MNYRWTIDVKWQPLRFFDMEWSALLTSVALHLGLLVIGSMLFQRSDVQTTLSANEQSVHTLHVTLLTSAVTEIAKSPPLPTSGQSASILLNESKVAFVPKVMAALHDRNASLSSQSIFYSTSEVDKKAVPLSEFNVKELTGVYSTGLPITLRLYFDVQGNVVRCVVTKGHPDDEQASAKLIAMVKETRFLPAKMQGRDVPSFQEVEFHLQDLVLGAE